MDIDHERRGYVAEMSTRMGCDSAALVAPGGSGAITGRGRHRPAVRRGSLRIDADPATGAAAGPIAVFLGQLVPTRGTTFGWSSSRAPSWAAPHDSRRSRLRGMAPAEVRVTGSVVPVIEGWVTLPDDRRLGCRGSARELAGQQLHQQCVGPGAVGHALVGTHHSDRAEPDLAIGRDGRTVVGGRVDGQPVMAPTVDEVPGEHPDGVGAKALPMDICRQEQVDGGIPEVGIRFLPGLM